MGPHSAIGTLRVGITSPEDMMDASVSLRTAPPESSYRLCDHPSIMCCSGSPQTSAKSFWVSARDNCVPLQNRSVGAETSRTATATPASSTHTSQNISSVDHKTRTRFADEVEDGDDFFDIRPALLLYDRCTVADHCCSNGDTHDVICGGIKPQIEPVLVENIGDDGEPVLSSVRGSSSAPPCQQQPPPHPTTQPNQVLTSAASVVSETLLFSVEEPHQIIRDNSAEAWATGGRTHSATRHHRAAVVVHHSPKDSSSNRRVTNRRIQGGDENRRRYRRSQPQQQEPLIEVLWKGTFEFLDEFARKSWRKALEFIRHFTGGSYRRAMRWIALTAALQVSDIPVASGCMGAAQHDSAALIAADMPRLQGEPDDKQVVEMVLRNFCTMYPGVGYNQGYDSACMAIYLATGRNSGATLSVFAKWAACTGVFMFQVAEGEHQAACEKAAAYARLALRKHASFVFLWLSRDPVMVDGFDIGDSQTLLANVFLRPLVSLCSRLQFRDEVLGDIVDKVLVQGKDGSAVSLWVACTLMCIAAREDGGRRRRRGEVMSVARRLDQVSANVHSWNRLEASACISLHNFIRGFRIAVGSTS